MLKILMLTGDAGEAQEIYYAKYRLEEEGWEVQIAALEKRAFLSVVHDFEPGFDTYTEKPGYRVTADLGLDEVQARRVSRSRAPGRTSAGIPEKPAQRRLPWFGTFLRPASRSPPIAMGLYWSWPRDSVEGKNPDLLPRTRTGYPRGGCRVRESGRGRRRDARDRARLARQWALDAGVCPVAQADLPEAQSRRTATVTRLAWHVRARARSKIDRTGAS